jgi:hypothetical protein
MSSETPAISRPYKWPTLALTVSVILVLCLGISDAVREFHERSLLTDGFALVCVGLVYATSMAREFKRLEALTRPGGFTGLERWPVQIWFELVLPLVNLVVPFIRMLRLARLIRIASGSQDSLRLTYALILIWWTAWLCAWGSLLGGNSYIADGLLNISLVGSAAASYVTLLLVLRMV